MFKEYKFEKEMSFKLPIGEVVVVMSKAEFFNIDRDEYVVKYKLFNLNNHDLREVFEKFLMQKNLKSYDCTGQYFSTMQYYNRDNNIVYDIVALDN